MGTRKKNPFDKTDLAIWLLLPAMLLCTAGIAIMLAIGSGSIPGGMGGNVLRTTIGLTCNCSKKLICQKKLRLYAPDVCS